MTRCSPSTCTGPPTCSSSRRGPTSVRSAPCGGELVSLFRPHDHVWHKGIAWSLPVVGDENFWGGPTFVSGEGYVQLPNNGSQPHRAFDERSDAAAGAVSSNDLDWVTEAGETVFDERRTVGRDRARRRRLAARVRDADAQRVRSRPPDRLADHPRARERRLRRAVLARPALVHRRRPARARRRGRRRAPRHPRAVDGLQRAPRRHRRRLDDRDGRRPRQRAHPTAWFARSEEFACICPAPFFSDEHTVVAGDTLVLRYGVVIADGASDPARAADLAAVGAAALPALQGESWAE